MFVSLMLMLERCNSILTIYFLAVTITVPLPIQMGFAEKKLL